MLSFTGIVALATIISYISYKFWDHFSRLRKIPTPSGSSILWGHEWDIFEDDRAMTWKRWIAECGPVFKVKATWGHHDILVVTDMKAIERLTASNVYNYPHSAVFRPIIERLLGRGLSWVEGAKEHKAMRAVLNPAFTHERVRDMAPTIWMSVNSVVERMGEVIDQAAYKEDKNGGDAREGLVVNMLDWTATSTLDVIGHVAFDHDFQQGLSPEACLIKDGWRKQAKVGMTFQGFVSLLVIRQFPFIAKLPLPAIKAQEKTKLTIQPLARKLINRGVSDLARGTDILSILLRNNLGEKEQKRVSDAELLDHITTFFIAGHETTSVILNMTLYSLACDKARQDKLRKELMAFGGSPSFEELWGSDALPYLDAVTKEGMRIYPPSTRNEKVAENDDIIPLAVPIKGTDGKMITHIPIKAGQVIYIPSIAVNRLDSAWGDGDAFRPERWLESEREKVFPDSSHLPGGWSSLITFWLGPRKCIAYRLAVFEMKVLIYAFIRAFEFETVAPIETRFSATMQPRVVGKAEEGPFLPLRIRRVE